jgi:DNA polymerase-3 subunit epsilon
VTDYLLFIDTETTGLPKKWDLPYSAKGNWPFGVQFAWIIYTKDGQKVKEENHFIKENDVKISTQATKIHGISEAFLHENGQSRREVMNLLAADIEKFQPLVIGHFMEFDYHIIGVDSYRAELENPVKNETTFCTMLATTHLVRHPNVKFFSLGELYKVLFNTALHCQHNAVVDAQATADCFFELVKRGEVNDEVIASQQKQEAEPVYENKSPGCTIPAFFFIFLFLLILYHL